MCRRPVVVALSGMDGAGKSTISRTIIHDLDEAGITAHGVWTRIGLRGRGLERIAKVGRRVFSAPHHAAGGDEDRGMPSGPRAARHGVSGWAWMSALTVSFLWNISLQYIRGLRADVVIFDRHLVDTMVTLDVLYEGASTLAHRTVIARLLPTPDLSYFLDVPASIARSRKPDDIFEERALRRQRDAYYAHLPTDGTVCRLDATRTVEDLTDTITAAIVERFEPRHR